MAKIIIPLNEVKEGMKVASNIYNSDDKRIVDIGTVITKDIIETLKRNSITTVSVMELLDLKKENTVNTGGDGKKAVVRGLIEENGKKILKIDSEEVAKKKEMTIEKTKSLYEAAKNGGGIDFDSMKKRGVCPVFTCLRCRVPGRRILRRGSWPKTFQHGVRATHPLGFFAIL